MGIYKTSELLGVDAATTAWKTRVGKEDPGEGQAAGPAPATGGGGDVFTVAGPPVDMSFAASDGATAIDPVENEDVRRALDEIGAKLEAARYGGPAAGSGSSGSGV